MIITFFKVANNPPLISFLFFNIIFIDSLIISSNIYLYQLINEDSHFYHVNHSLFV